MSVADRIASIAGVSVADMDASLLAALGTRGADVTGGILMESGISMADLPMAIEATRRCIDLCAWTPENAAEFVATAAAIGDITGPALLLVPNLARVARSAAG